MRNNLPPIAKAAARLLVCIEEAVKRFPKCHKYVVGSDLRVQAMAVSRCVYRAWREPDHKLQRVKELSESVSDLKITMQLADQVRAFGSFGEFEALARLIADIGRQSGGWYKQLHSKGQSAKSPAASRSASTLSSQDASREAIR